MKTQRNGSRVLNIHLGVALAAVSTNMGLDMLGLLVLGDVLKERLFVREALVAGVALVGLVSLVAARVGLQVGQLGEGLGAAWNRKRLVRKGSVGFLIAEQSSRRFSSQSVDKVQLVVRSGSQSFTREIGEKKDCLPLYQQIFLSAAQLFIN